MYYRPGYHNVTNMERATVFDTDMTVASPGEIEYVATDLDEWGLTVLAQNLGSLAQEAEGDSRMIGGAEVLVLLRAHDARFVADLALTAGVAVETVAEFPSPIKRMLEGTGINRKDESAVLYDFSAMRRLAATEKVRGAFNSARRKFVFPKRVVAKVLQHSA